MKKIVIVVVLAAYLVCACTPTARHPTQLQEPLASTAAGLPVPTATFTFPPTETAAAVNPPPSTQSLIATAGPISYGPNHFPATINPLTGLPVSDLNTLNRRPMAIKIQLYPRGQRPVVGVSMADIVYDYYQNDGLTRLNAIFYGSDARQIGPIRSARLFDENIIQMYKAIFAFGGAAQYVLNRFYEADYADRLVTERYRNCPPMCREDPNGYNFLFTNSSELALYAIKIGVKNNRQNLDGMSFNSQSPPGGRPGQQLTTRYSISSYNRWDYDPDSGRYLRFQDVQEDTNGQGEAFSPLVDGSTGQQIAADNVIILFLPHNPAELARDKDAVDIHLLGDGDAFAFRDGMVYEVNWNRPNKDATLFLTFKDGSPFPFKPGVTWFQVVGQSSKVGNNDGIWRVKSQLP